MDEMQFVGHDAEDDGGADEFREAEEEGEEASENHVGGCKGGCFTVLADREMEDG